MRGSNKRKTKLAVLAGFGLVMIATAVLTASSTSIGFAYGDGAANYKAKCAICHAADGSGNTPSGKAMKLRDLRSADVQNQSDDQLYNVIAKGKGKMTGYEKSLGAAACKELVVYTRKLGGR